MLKKLRITVAWVVFILAVLLVLDFSGALHLWMGWVAKVQLLPAILAANVVALVVVGVLTLVFGRIYCSVLCPLGIMQDGISNVSARRKGKKARFRYSKEAKWIYWLKGILLGFVAMTIIIALFRNSASNPVVSLLDPWANFGRIAQNLFAPVWRLGNNLLAWIAERADSYAFHTTDVYIKSGIAFGVAALWLAGLAVLAWWKGRIYCNSICPVGTLLGLVSRVSIFKPVFDASKCTSCGVCEKSCKSECIDSKAMTIDRSRCVVCFDCMDKCKFGAMSYTACKPKTTITSPEANEGNPDDGSGNAKKGMNRRNFFSIAALAAAASPAALRAQQVERVLLQVDGGLTDLVDKQRPGRQTPITPPGSKDARNMTRHCTACQLCVAACPNNVLVPSSGLATLMQPEMTFERGYCRPECFECGEVCPTGAIEKITAADKTAISVGNAHYVRERCVVTRDNVPCTECERHCPTKAITLVHLNAGEKAKEDAWEARGGRGNKPAILKIPAIDTTLCTGCGACEHLCPSNPYSAIYVEGHSTHHAM